MKFFERKVIFLSNLNVTLLLTDINPKNLGWHFIGRKRKLNYITVHIKQPYLYTLHI